MDIDYRMRPRAKTRKRPAVYLLRLTAAGEWRRVCRVGPNAGYVLARELAKNPQASFLISKGGRDE